LCKQNAGEVVKAISESSGGFAKVSRMNGEVDFIVYSPEEWEFVEEEK